MNLIGRARVIAFIDWLSGERPEIASLREIPEEQFLVLVTAFEASKGIAIDPDHHLFWAWQDTHWVFTSSKSDADAMHSLS